MSKLETDVEVLKTVVSNIKDRLKGFVSIDRFNPIEKIVWTLTTLLITGLVGALIRNVLK